MFLFYLRFTPRSHRRYPEQQRVIDHLQPVAEGLQNLRGRFFQRILSFISCRVSFADTLPPLEQIFVSKQASKAMRQTMIETLPQVLPSTLSRHCARNTQRKSGRERKRERTANMQSSIYAGVQLIVTSRCEATLGSSTVTPGLLPSLVQDPSGRRTPSRSVLPMK